LRVLLRSTSLSQIPLLVTTTKFFDSLEVYDMLCYGGERGESCIQVIVNQHSIQRKCADGYTNTDTRHSQLVDNDGHE